MQIADKNTKEAVFIIAEIGVNHNGDIDLAKKMIISAKESGADAVKFQCFCSDDLVTNNAKKTPYQLESTDKKQSYCEMLKSFEFCEKDWMNLNEFASENNIMFLATPFDYKSLGFLESLSIPIYKIASSDITNIPFLEEIAGYNKPIVLSTGSSYLTEIESAVKAIKKRNNNDIAILHCTSSYPASLEDINLNAMLTINKKFDLPVGYSDHTEGYEVSIAAVALGAEIIEKHFTLDNSLPGPDQLTSIDPGGFKKMVQYIRNIEKALGNSIKAPTEKELNSRSYTRKSVTAKCDINENEIIKEEMLICKRPGTGLSPIMLNEIVGKKINISIKKDTLLKLEMFDE